jgi:hypothetical protein
MCSHSTLLKPAIPAGTPALFARPADLMKPYEAKRRKK